MWVLQNVDTGEEQEQVQPAKPPVENNTTNSSFGNYGMPFGSGQQQLTYHSSPQLALEGGPLTSNNTTAAFNNGEPPVDLSDETRPEVNPTLEFPDTPLIGGDDLLFPNTPVLLTPCTSPRP